ncbi:MAG: NAD-dependent epimerase/dehydratase family protein [Actinomycetota bacterium]|nr:NAD-dependent epimerase/dehydratase family protein [Actinomycetota bacterium]
MSVALVTGSGGLIGSEASVYFADIGLEIVGIDNDMRRIFFGEEASTAWNATRLRRRLGRRYRHYDVDIRDRAGIFELFKEYGRHVELVIHAAAQPSHDWAAREPLTDFDINAVGTLNLLEASRQFAPDAVFVFTSTNKVYGDRPNELPLVELEKRYDVVPDHTYTNGIREDMPIDACLHSLFGASKVAADVLVQEYGRYFGMKTACLRAGTLTGPQHSATQLHGFLAYIVRCNMTASHYTVLGYKGKQVRDALHSSDLIRAFHEFFKEPRVAEVYNLGGGRFSNCSVLEAIELSQEITGRELSWSYSDANRIGDHKWWISDNGKFQVHYPAWQLEYDVERILKEIFEANADKWMP